MLHTFKIDLKSPFGIMELDNYWRPLTGMRPESCGKLLPNFLMYRKSQWEAGLWRERVKTEDGKFLRSAPKWGVGKCKGFRAYSPPSCPLPLNSSIKCLHFCSRECNSPLNVMFNDFTLSLFVHHFQQ